MIGTKVITITEINNNLVLMESNKRATMRKLISLNRLPSTVKKGKRKVTSM
jgi:hypothetical protein